MADKTFFSRLQKLFSTSSVIRDPKTNRIKVVDVNKIQSMNNYESNRAVDNYLGVRSTTTAGLGYDPSYGFQLLKQDLYRDYDSMDQDSILASALDIFSDETTLKDEYGQMLSITSTKETIRETLENLFYDVLNIEFNLWPWVRNLVKYGDMYLKLDIVETIGVTNVIPLSPYYMVREEDPNNPDNIIFRYEATDGIYVPDRRGKKVFDNYEIAHFRLIADTNFLPYGKSMLEPARKVWGQLSLMEDAMMIHRIMRAPQKRVFKIDIGSIPPTEVDTYMNQVIDKMKKVPYLDEQTGQYNLKFNLQPVRWDTKIPLLDGRTITIKELTNEIKDGKTNYVYSIDRENNNKIVAGEVLECKLTKENADICRVTLDDDSYIDFEPNHPVMLRTGEYKSAKDLLPSERLMPFKTEKSTNKDIFGYEMLLDPSTEKIDYTHRIVARQFHLMNGKNVIHHSNFHKLDNTPENLDVSMSYKEHIRYHYQHQKDVWASRTPLEKSIIFKKISDSTKKWFADGNKPWCFGLTKETDIRLMNRNDPRNGKSWAEYFGNDYSDRRKKEMSILMKEVRSYHNPMDDPKIRAQMAKFMPGENRRRWANPDFKAKVAKAMSHTYDDYLINEINKLIKLYQVNKTYQLVKLFNDNEILLAYFNKINNTKKNCGKITKYSLNKLFEREGYTPEEYFKYSQSLEILCNHKVKSVKILVEKDDVYCMEVKDFHNFAIDSHGGTPRDGIFVKNSMLEDFYLPVRGGQSGTEITDLGGMEWTGTDDVEYLKNKMMAALKIPKTFLGYGEALSGKATLSAEDVRFARTIERIQRIVVAELTKIAIVHLYSQGFKDMDLVNFTLDLTTSSTVYELERMELWAQKVALARDIKELKLVPNDWIYENIFKFSAEQIEDYKEGVIEDVKRAFRLNQIENEGNDPTVTSESFGTRHDLAIIDQAKKNKVYSEETDEDRKIDARKVTLTPGRKDFKEKSLTQIDANGGNGRDREQARVARAKAQSKLTKEQIDHKLKRIGLKDYKLSKKQVIKETFNIVDKESDIFKDNGTFLDEKNVKI